MGSRSTAAALLERARHEEVRRVLEPRERVGVALDEKDVPRFEARVRERADHGAVPVAHREHQGLVDVAEA